MTSTTKFNFPFEVLTPIDGKPTNTTLQLLQQQLFTNARSVESPRGGGMHGHMALLLSDADYLARTGVSFDIPTHPGPAPPNPVGATAAQLAEGIRAYNQALADVSLYNRLRSALTAQILTAVNASFLRALADPDFGFADVTPLRMLVHLQTKYGTMTPEELETNRAALSDPWNFDDPIEDLWDRIANIRRVAELGKVPIPEITILTLTLAMIEQTGLLATTTEKFRLRPINEWTLDAFQADFELGNRERVRKLSAGAAGFHGAHHATAAPNRTVLATPLPSSGVPATAAALVTPAPAASPAAPVNVEGGRMYYCWTHGLSANRAHTSLTCLNKAEGHKDDATAFRMRGGNNTITSGRARRLPATTPT